MDTKKHKYIIIGLLVFLIIASTILINYGISYMCATKPLRKFSKLIEQEQFNDINLTIYYMSPYISTGVPLNVDALIKFGSSSDISDVEKIVISSNDLEEQVDLLNHISKATLIPVMKKSYLNARIYYVFETKKGDKTFDVAMWGGGNNSMFVNGVEVKENTIFYDVIIPFLPEDAGKELEDYVSHKSVDQSNK